MAYKIELFQNSSDLSVARTILHEAVHAYLIAHFRNNYSAAYSSYPDLIHDMNQNRYPQNANGLQHAEFVRNFVNDIATSLQEFGLGRGYNLPFQLYSDLAWAGLTDWAKRDSSGNLIKDSQGNQVYEETPWFKSAYSNPSDR